MQMSSRRRSKLHKALKRFLEYLISASNIPCYINVQWHKSEWLCVWTPCGLLTKQLMRWLFFFPLLLRFIDSILAHTPYPGGGFFNCIASACTNFGIKLHIYLHQPSTVRILTPGVFQQQCNNIKVINHICRRALLATFPITFILSAFSRIS